MRRRLGPVGPSKEELAERSRRATEKLLASIEAMGAHSYGAPLEARRHEVIRQFTMASSLSASSEIEQPNIPEPDVAGSETQPPVLPELEASDPESADIAELELDYAFVEEQIPAAFEEPRTTHFQAPWKALRASRCIRATLTPRRAAHVTPRSILKKAKAREAHTGCTPTRYNNPLTDFLKNLVSFVISFGFLFWSAILRILDKFFSFLVAKTTRQPQSIAIRHMNQQVNRIMARDDVGAEEKFLLARVAIERAWIDSVAPRYVEHRFPELGHNDYTPAVKEYNEWANERLRNGTLDRKPTPKPKPGLLSRLTSWFSRLF
jgi:hypothetical protein